MFFPCIKGIYSHVYFKLCTRIKMMSASPCKADISYSIYVYGHVYVGSKEAK